jgi:hypothetical protein
MREAVGDLWDFHATGAWVAITTNGVVKRDKTLVMGRGCAQEAATRFPGVPGRLGELVQYYGNHVCALKESKIVSFPVKHHWRDLADLELIARSAKELLVTLQSFLIRKIYLPRPGCGNGGLQWTDVRAVLKPILDDQVIVVSR